MPAGGGEGGRIPPKKKTQTFFLSPIFILVRCTYPKAWHGLFWVEGLQNAQKTHLGICNCFVNHDGVVQSLATALSSGSVLLQLDPWVLAWLPLASSVGPALPWYYRAGGSPSPPSPSSLLLVELCARPSPPHPPPRQGRRRGQGRERKPVGSLGRGRMASISGGPIKGGEGSKRGTSLFSLPNRFSSSRHKMNRLWPQLFSPPFSCSEDMGKGGEEVSRGLGL